jgi:UPF0755 protein
VGGATPARRVFIPRRSSLAAAAESLAAHQVIAHPRWFALYARLKRLDRKLQPGIYVFAAQTQWSEVLRRLATASATEYRLTIAEGLNLGEIAAEVEAQVGMPAASLLAAARDPRLIAEIGLGAGSLEGYLFPETYRVAFDVTPPQLLRRLADQFGAVWDSLAQRPARLPLPLARHEVVTLASIVEKEVRFDDERAIVAAVYFNRLRRRMPLEADPTVVYALGRRVPRLLFEHLEVNSPYNTYRRPGLPPGPIASPGRASLEAVLWPAQVPYLFFVARPDGRHIFSRTWREHSAAKAEAARLRRAAQGNGPPGTSR